MMVACGGGGEATTTTAPVATTSSAPATTTTVPATTSTTVLPPTTTAPEPTGPNWIVSGNGLIGHGDSESWTPPDADAAIEGGEEYQVIDLEGVAGTAVGSPVEICEPSQTPMVPLDPPLPVGFDEIPQVAIAHPSWDPVPHPVVTDQPSNPDLLAEADSFLAARGLDAGEVTQSLVFDLDGDGLDEELMVKQNLPEGLIGDPTAFSLVMLRKQLDVEPGIAIVEFSQGEDTSPYVLAFTVSAVADLNGDGQSEIVIDANYYEGGGTTVYEWINDDLGLVAALAGGCGA